MDIDFCAAGPCGKNGVCTDSGVGVTDPGYSCECHPGYEVVEREDGTGPTCSADDCAGNPCGPGGACFDMSKADPPGPQGTYSCECEPGYEVVKTKDGKNGEPSEYTCKRVECGIVPTIQNTRKDITGKMILKLNTWDSGEDKVDDFTGLPVLKSFDVVTYTCASGYSTDGNVGPEGRSFSVTCNPTGLLSQAISKDGATECQPVRCDNFMLPIVPFTNPLTNTETFYEYGDLVKFTCQDGYTTNGKVGGPPNFEIPCEKNGKFPSSHANCMPVSCGKPKSQFAAIRSTDKELKFTDSVTYTCKDGYTIDGEVGGGASYPMSCLADGTQSKGQFRSQRNRKCQKIKCSAPTQPQNAEPIVVEEQKMFEDTILVKCLDGYTIGGAADGDRKTSLVCMSDGHFSTMETSCEEIKFSISGILDDAQSAVTKLSKAKVTLSVGSYSTVATASISGLYKASVPAGNVTIEVMKAGYITQSKTISVTNANVAPGQGADMSLSKVLPPGAWRVVLTWKTNNTDLDSHFYFGNGKSAHMFWGNRNLQAAGTGGITAVLDRDDPDGYGPETSTRTRSGL
jgi:hypothetical protein